jgi:hypothetical protein
VRRHMRVIKSKRRVDGSERAEGSEQTERTERTARSEGADERKVRGGERRNLGAKRPRDNEPIHENLEGDAGFKGASKRGKWGAEKGQRKAEPKPERMAQHDNESDGEGHHMEEDERRRRVWEGRMSDDEDSVAIASDKGGASGPYIEDDLQASDGRPEGLERLSRDPENSEPRRPLGIRSPKGLETKGVARCSIKAEEVEAPFSSAYSAPSGGSRLESTRPALTENREGATRAPAIPPLATQASDSSATAGSCRSASAEPLLSQEVTATVSH